MKPVTRFAPSPTGMLHIGGARTALFNLLFAKRHGGAYRLRIEDTDKARSTQAAFDPIQDGLAWLGLASDEPPVFQSERAARHADCVADMLARGRAFKCYVTPEELQARREAGEAARRAAKEDGVSNAEREARLAEAEALLAPFRSPYRDGGEAPAADMPFTVRLRAPDAGDIAVSDAVQGRISVKAAEIDDLVLLRADGTPTYMLAVVVDDHDMGVTHVIRGDDHLRNTFRQVPIYQAMDWSVPVFAHVPMIHGPDGAKLSKRHGATSVTEYREQGYLPEAVVNYLARLGWGHGDMELFTLDEAAAVFDLSGVNRAPARLDLDKLASINAHHMRLADDDRLFALLTPYFDATGGLSEVQSSRVRAAMGEMKTRGATLPELAEAFRFLRVERPVELNKKSRKAVRGEGLDRLAAVREAICDVEPWASEALSAAIAAHCETAGVSMGQVGPPLRAALTGGLPAPEIGQVLEWLGRAEALGRLDDQINAGRDATAG